MSLRVFRHRLVHRLGEDALQRLTEKMESLQVGLQVCTEEFQEIQKQLGDLTRVIYAVCPHCYVQVKEKPENGLCPKCGKPLVERGGA